MNTLLKIVRRYAVPWAFTIAATASHGQEIEVFNELQLREKLHATNPLNPDNAAEWVRGSFSRVVIAADITLKDGDDVHDGTHPADRYPGRQLVVPDGVSLEFKNGARLRKGKADVEIWLMGSVPDRPEQFFGPGVEVTTVQGVEATTVHQWNPGEIRGLIGGMARRPEWWGAFASPSEITSQTVREASDDSRGINCAVGATLDGRIWDHEQDNNGNYLPERDKVVFHGSNGGHTVLLRSGYYYISSPIFMTSSRCILKGVPAPVAEDPELPSLPPLTKIRAFKNDNAAQGWKWTDRVNRSLYTWSRIRQFFAPTGNSFVDGNDSPLSQWDADERDGQVAMIYMGGLQSNEVFEYKVLYGGFLWSDIDDVEMPIHIKHRRPNTFGTAVHDLDLEAIPGGVDLPAPESVKLPMSLISIYAKVLLYPTGAPVYYPGSDPPRHIGFLAPWMEENTLIEGVHGRHFSGYGVGLPWSTAINGLTLRDFDLGPADDTLATIPYGVFFPMHTGTCLVEKGTIRVNHRAKAGTANGKFDGTGILAQGLAVIKVVKIKDCHVGVDIIGNDSAGAVSLDEIRYAHGDPNAPPPAGFFAPHSAVVRIRNQNAEADAGGQVGAVVSKITSEAYYPPNPPNPTGPSEIMPLLYEPYGNENGSHKKFLMQSSSTQLEFFARRHRYANPGRVLPVPNAWPAGQ